jgi:predicted RNA binding protein YcfA (HicA-like mRNA interferase family)
VARARIRVDGPSHDEHQIIGMAAIRPVPFQDLVRVFEHEGFTFDRQEGDHRIYVKAGIRRPLVIPMYRAVPIPTLSAI